MPQTKSGMTANKNASLKFPEFWVTPFNLFQTLDVCVWVFFVLANSVVLLV